MSALGRAAARRRLSGVLALLVGRPVLRLRGHYLAIATLGLGVLVAIVLTNESRWTGGPDGMTVAAPQRCSAGASAGAETWYWITGGALLVGAWLALNLIDTPTGRALRALHDSEVAARVVGIDVAGYKLRAFVIAAVYASVAGSLLALDERLHHARSGRLSAFGRARHHGGRRRPRLGRGRASSARRCSLRCPRC